MSSEESSGDVVSEDSSDEKSETRKDGYRYKIRKKDKRAEDQKKKMGWGEWLKSKFFGRRGRKGKGKSKKSKKATPKFSEKKVSAKEKLRAKMWLRQRKWPKKEIPVKFHPKFPEKRRVHIHKVIAHLNKLTCVRLFVAKDKEKRHHILVNQLKPGCFSFVGHTKLKKGYQDLNLHKNCFYGLHKVVFHETLHAMGFKHMQIRYDRDEYVKVHRDRVNPKKWKNFAI